jgi:hypothetical protein
MAIAKEHIRGEKLPWISKFLSKFIRNFSGICTPILDMVKKRHKYFKWTEEAEKSFRILKEKITEQPILVLQISGRHFKYDVMLVE